MPVGKRRGSDVTYNVQISVDDKHHLIVDHEVTNAVTDQGQLSCMALRAKEALHVERLEVVADKGVLRWQGSEGLSGGSDHPLHPQA